MQDGVNLIEIDYDGIFVWEFDKFEHINDPGRDHRWMARQHHDYQRKAIRLDIMCREWTQSHWRGIP